MKTMVEVQNLTKEFNGKTVLDRITFEVKESEIFGYLGPNGAGKTTTMRIILGLLKPTVGKTLVLGQNLGTNEDLRRKVGVLLENDGLYGLLSAYENLNYYARLYGVHDREEKIKELLDFAGLSDKKNDKVGNFSKGMKRKLALSRSLINDPAILFFDEPSAGLDPEAQRIVRELILKLSGGGKTIFLCSHDLDEVQRICSKIAILEKGKIKAFDTIENLREKFGKPFVEITFADTKEVNKALDLINSLSYVSECKKENIKLEVILKGASSSLLLNALMKKGIKVEEIKKATKSLEDIYLYILKQSEEEI